MCLVVKSKRCTLMAVGLIPLSRSFRSWDEIAATPKLMRRRKKIDCRARMSQEGPAIHQVIAVAQLRKSACSSHSQASASMVRAGFFGA